MEVRAGGVGRMERFFVPDLTPMDRTELRDIRPGVVFIAESPHISEVEPGRMRERRPLCGVAGRRWWSLLSELLEARADPDVSLERLLGLCGRFSLAVMNSVQFPLDPKITALYPGADPVRNLGFSKSAGEWSYKRLRNGRAVRAAIANLRVRLRDPRLEGAEIWCLGNDSEWFVTQALSAPGDPAIAGKVPHPSAWWRRSGLFGRIAREKLGALLERAQRSRQAG